MYSGLSGLENLHFYGRLYGVPDVADRARMLLDQVGLDLKARERTASTYSRGMLQRLALARALLHEPSILLLDEPFTGLDRTGAAALARALAEAKESGRIILVITHDFEPIAGLTDHIVVLRRGKVAHEDRRSEAIGSAAQTGFSREELTSLYHLHSE
jgi:heme exporter protein A